MELALASSGSYPPGGCRNREGTRPAPSISESRIKCQSLLCLTPSLLGISVPS